MKIRSVNDRVLLSNLWLFILLNMIFRDIHQLGKSGYIEQLMSGSVNGISLTDELMLIGAVLAELPILMVLLSRILMNKLNKWANYFAGIVTLLVFITMIPTADMDDIFHLGFEVSAIIWILRIAWKLPYME